MSFIPKIYFFGRFSKKMFSPRNFKRSKQTNMLFLLAVFARRQILDSLLTFIKILTFIIFYGSVYIED